MMVPWSSYYEDEMNYYCPKCSERFNTSDLTEPPPAICPECGADLYPEEIVYQQLISDANVDGDMVLV